VWDLAATRENSKCGSLRCYTREDDALRQHWAEDIARGDGGERWLWNNPPYSKPNLPLFTAKAREECRLGAAIVQLVPATVDAGWFQDNVFYGGDIVTKRVVRNVGPLDGTEIEMVMPGGFLCTVRFLRRRIQFFNPHRDVDGESAKTGSAIIEWRPRRLC